MDPLVQAGASPDGETETAPVVTGRPGGAAEQNGSLPRRSRSSGALGEAEQIDQLVETELEEFDFAYLREEYYTVLREVEAGEKGDFKARGRPRCQGTNVAAKVLHFVDDLISENWHSSDRSLWKFNCLVYEGAVVVEGWVKRSRKKPDGRPCWSDAIKNKQGDVKQLRRKIGWLTSEISRRRAGTRATERQSNNIRRLRRIFGPRVVHDLAIQLEQQKVFLKIRVAQLKRIRSNLRHKAMNDKYRRQGPRALEAHGGPSPNVSSQPSADQVTEFWNGVIGVPGRCNLEDPAVVGWQEGMRELPGPTWEGPDAAVWTSVRKKIASWKAPGRDGLHAFWWKQFHQAATLLWEIKLCEGRSEVPAWFVEGRTVLIPKAGCQGKPNSTDPLPV